jgi:hypothetical protein
VGSGLASGASSLLDAIANPKKLASNRGLPKGDAKVCEHCGLYVILCPHCGQVHRRGGLTLHCTACRNEFSTD